nr:transposase, MuDR, MULE transposase domain protein [Tanacetum cinerariifolium]
TLNPPPEESFAELPLYCHNLKVKNPGTITHIEPHDQDRFEIFFLAVGVAGRCCRHLLMNLPEKCLRFISKEELFWKACKAYRFSDFEERFSTLRIWLPSVANKLDTICLEKWARVHFPVRFDKFPSRSEEQPRGEEGTGQSLPAIWTNSANSIKTSPVPRFKCIVALLPYFPANPS